MRIIEADILTDIDPNVKTVILHGSNCFGKFGNGIAKYLAEKYPQVIKADIETTIGDISKLGTYTCAIIDPNFHILNCYIQYKYGHQGVYVDYRAIQRCFNRIVHNYHGWSIRLPMIGCGLAGGDWNVVSQLVKLAFSDEDVTVYRK